MTQPEKKSTLLNWFSIGKKPEAAHFAAWIHSFFHKSEDGLNLNDKGDLGIGEADPKAKLHLAGGLIIGNVPDGMTPPPVEGTLRWTGRSLEVYFGGTWKPIWQDVNFVTTSREITITGLSANTETTVNRVSLKRENIAFPSKYERLIALSFSVDYDVTVGDNMQRLKIKLFGHDDRMIWVSPEIDFSVSGNSTSAFGGLGGFGMSLRKAQGRKELSYTADVDVKSWTSYKAQLEIIYLGTNHQKGELSVTVAAANMTCVCRK